jgi:hypothetical protein
MPIDELIPSGPVEIGIRLPHDVIGRSVKSLVAGTTLRLSLSGGWARVTVPEVLDHEVLVIE